MRALRTGVVVAGCFVLAGVGWRMLGPESLWAELREAEDSFRVHAPAGFRQVTRNEVGTTFCVISCDEARIEVRFETRYATAEEACAAIAPSLRTAIGGEPDTTPRFDLGGCLWAPLADVRDSAFVQVFTFESGPGCLAATDPDDRDRVCAELVFNSGID